MTSVSHEGLDVEVENLSSQSDSDSGQSTFDPSRSTNTMISSNEGGSCLKKPFDTEVSSKCSVFVKDRIVLIVLIDSCDYQHNMCNAYVKIVDKITT